ncbi:MAG TPA: hypothetical protein VEG08_03255 [Terriglobales bacterium]|nr:hypothetical protein [Terriglobales bacterium]
MAKKHLAVWAALCLLLGTVVAAARAQDLSKRLTNQDVIEMVNLGLSDDVIIEKIRTADGIKFDTSVDGLKALKAAKVSDAVIKAMINPKETPAPAAAAAAPAAPADDPNLPPREIGMYWKDGTNWVTLYGQNVSQAKIGGRWAHAFSYGIASKHWNAEVQGEHSRNVVKDRNPVFYVYVPEGMSPTDYTLLKLDKKSDHRQFEVGSIAGWGGGKSGLRESNMRGFDFVQIAPRTFKLTLVQELKPGEYGFFMGTGQALAMGNGTEGGNAQGRIYDFQIPQ